MQAEQLTYTNFLSVLMIAPLLFLWAALPNDAVAMLADWLFTKISKLLLELPFSRNMETEADIVGMELASKACFDIREAPAFWARMKLLTDAESDEDDMDFPEYLSTHPSHERRHEFLTEMLPNALEKRSTFGCCKLTGPDPLLDTKNIMVYK